jgi:N-acetylneuraminic acid mutarotase
LITLTKSIYLFIAIFIAALTSNAQGVWNKVTEHPALNGLYGPNGNSVNDNIYISFGRIKGSVPSSALYAYNVSTNTWTQKRDFPGYGRYASTSFVIGNTIYYMGGTVGQTPYYNDLWAFNVLDNTWIQKASMPGSGRIVAMSFVINGKAYITGGATDNVTYLNDTWEYNPTSDKWQQKASIPTDNNTGIVAASSFVIKNKGYICGGKYAVQSYLDSNWQYDPITDKWATKASLPKDAGTLGGFSFSLNDNSPNARGYYGLGVNTLSPYTEKFYEYNANTDTWTPISLFTGKGRYYGISCVINNEAYIGFGDLDYPTSAFEKDIWKLSFPLNPNTLSIRGKIHQQNSFLKNGWVVLDNLANNIPDTIKCDSEGSFNFQFLSEGKYVLHAIPNSGENYTETYYPNTSDPLKTDTLILGGSISEIDLFMNSSKPESDPSEAITGYFNVHPNPFTNQLSITCANKNVRFNKIQIDNMTGGIVQEIILDKETDSFDINFEHLPTVFYILKVPTSAGIYIKKIVK